MSEADENGVRALLADMAIGYRARDAERITGHYAPEIVMFGLAPPLRIRRGQLAEIGGRQADMTSADGVRAWLAGFGDAPLDYETRDVEVVTGGDVGYAHCLVRMGSPGTFSMWFRMTIGVRRSSGSWQITHLHASTPFYMDQTRAAALDLAP